MKPYSARSMNIVHSAINQFSTWASLCVCLAYSNADWLVLGSGFIGTLAIIVLNSMRLSNDQPMTRAERAQLRDRQKKQFSTESYKKGSAGAQPLAQQPLNGPGAAGAGGAGAAGAGGVGARATRISHAQKSEIDETPDKSAGILSSQRRHELGSQEMAHNEKIKQATPPHHAQHSAHHSQHATHHSQHSGHRSQHSGHQSQHSGRLESDCDEHFEPPNSRNTRDAGILSSQRRQELTAMKKQFANEKADYQMEGFHDRRQRSTMLRSQYQSGQKVKVRCHGDWLEGQISHVDSSGRDSMYDIFVQDGRHTWEEHRVAASRIEEQEGASKSRPEEDVNFARRRMAALAGKHDDPPVSGENRRDDREKPHMHGNNMSDARQRLGRVAAGSQGYPRCISVLHYFHNSL